VRLQGHLDGAALKRGIEEITRRHEALRTRFPSVRGKAVQVIEQYSNVAWSEIDLCHWTEDVREVQALSLVNEEARKPINLAAGPLMRVLLLQLKPEDHILVVTIHHIAFDVWSEGVFIRELMTLYNAFSTGQPSPLADLPIQYADFSVWQHQRLQGDMLDELLAYWQGHLHRASILELPTDYPRQAVHSYRGAMKRFSIEKECSHALVRLSRQKDVTLFMTLLTGFMTLLYQYTGQTDIVVGTDIANRTRSETEQLIGFFVNLLVLRGNLSNNPRFSDLLAQVHTMVLDAYAHQDLPFEKLVETLHLERTGNQIPLVRVLFVLQNVPWVSLDLAGLTVTPVDVEQTATRFELAFFMWESPEGLMGTVNYDEDLFESTTIARMIDHFKTLLLSISAQPDIYLDALKLYGEETGATKRKSLRHKLKQAKRKEITLSE
jgi:Condensation domain